jgi:hypothetical protein
MPQGRCAGCGHSDSASKVAQHVLNCPAYLKLFREDPKRCLDPEAEYVRYREYDDTSEARAVRRDARLRDRFTEMERLQELARQRWRAKDILED